MTDHPITPPPEMVEKWVSEIWHEGTPVRVAASDIYIATEAYRAGADQELEACCEWISDQDWTWTTAKLRDARRPKPPSLRKQALDALQSMRISPELIAIINANTDLKDKYETIRSALEQLND